MNEAGGKDFSLFNLVFLELSLNHAAACLIICHNLKLLDDFELLYRQLALHMLGQLKESLCFLLEWLWVHVLTDSSIVIRQKFDA